ncbi:phospholipase effector Tle1 domain-containing protein [Flavobacterium pectinovorum]|uniref:Uncharacterized alpha/beta hydrolase domain n=1 Tax=Flavobacterium pectinovorum TaxID=29533 RepID=A0AB36NXV1_9FLAO|nr:DUF2235 domain-containing protein [Flavobacterium pectinovorum]OXA99506.1 hypothetical protein B0A72_21925 [Flavobacterium pectinovorum]SHN08296.1 Uncharacterized alpha/beta hydrolase domain [Flavobacterium pectinovorum]
MATNISFGNYTPPPLPNGTIDVVIGVFFDGTLNNKTNTQERLAKTETYKKHGGGLEDSTSYNNDWSNVARLWDNYDKDIGVYIEGIGTEDRKGDEIDGKAFGAEETGIVAKVTKGCVEIAKKVMITKKTKKAESIKTLTIDVFGFSRGAAAARHFVYEVSKSGQKVPYIAPYGNLGSELRKAGLTIEIVKIRFLGLFDTVSSYSEDTWTSSPNFSNDIEQLNLDNITKAKKIVHFVAENEHRVNFDLTNVAVDKKINGVKQKPIYYGIEKKFPGVHCDIGGSYENGTEKKDEILNGDKEILLKRKEELIAQGWFKDKQLFVIHNYTVSDKLSSDRFVKKTYSYIPLHFMADYGIKDDLPFSIEKITKKYSISDDKLLISVKERLKDYILEDGKPYDFKWFTKIHEIYKGVKVSDQRYLEYKKELEEQKNLRTLRNEYLHWSADYDGTGMDPRSNGVREVH